jgi:hypothetical protein
MSYATINSQPVLDVRLCLPLRGRWHASISAIPDGDAPTGRIDLVLANDTIEQIRVSGTPVQSDVLLDTGVITLVGAAGLASKCTPRAYREAIVRSVLDDLMRDADESLSTAIDANLLTRQLPRWSNIGLTVGEALDLLAEQLEVNWRVLVDGTVWLGVESWPEVSPAADVSQYDPIRNATQFSSDDFIVLPGQKFGGRNISYVEVDFIKGVMRERVFYEDNEGSDAKGALKNFVRSVMASVDFHALYTAKVTSQNADGTCEVQVDDTRFPGYSRVPIKLGIPETTVKVSAGATVLLGFDDGWPDSPYVALWNASTLTEINIGGATQFAALANLVVNQLNSIASAFNGHTHPGVTVGGGTSGPVAAVITVGAVAAEKVKIK